MGRSFDYPHTCSDINKAIDKTESVLFDQFYDFAGEICSHLTDDVKIKLANEWKVSTYQLLSDYFETVRKTNEAMRKAADKQIDDLERRIEELEQEINDNEKRD